MRGEPEAAPESESEAEPGGGSSGGGSWDCGVFLTIEKLRQRRLLSWVLDIGAGREGSSDKVSLSLSQGAYLSCKTPELLFMYMMPSFITSPSLIVASPPAADASVILEVIFWLLALLLEEPKSWITEGCLPTESSSLSSESRNLVCFPRPVAEGFFDVLFCCSVECTGGAAC